MLLVSPAILLLRGTCDSLFRWLFGLCSQLLGMALNQLVSRVPTTRKDLRQRQHTIVLIEKKLSATLGRVGLSGIHLHHNTGLTAGSRYLDNHLIGPPDWPNYVTPGR